MFKDSKILVAGHTGLVGSALLKALASKGYRNIIRRTHAEVDLTRQDAVERLFLEERPAYVFLAAGKTAGILANRDYPADLFHANIAIQDHIFEASRIYDVRHVVFYGSSCAYPRECPQPIKEEYLLTGPIEETSDAYAAAKIAGLVACRRYNHQHKNGRFISLVPNTIYGPHDHFDVQSSHVMAALIRKFHEARRDGQDRVVLLGSGNPVREFIYSDDVAEASIFAMENAARLENGHYNIGSGTGHSIRQIAELISSMVGYAGEILWDRDKPDGAPVKILDSSRFRSLGWSPKISLDAGLRLTYQWFSAKMGNSPARAKSDSI